MTFIKNDYIHRRTNGFHKGKLGKDYTSRDWYLVKYAGVGYTGTVDLGAVVIPKEYVGKKVRFKIEVIKNANQKS